jgi:hypothetical protein
VAARRVTPLHDPNRLFARPVGLDQMPLSGSDVDGVHASSGMSASSSRPNAPCSDAVMVVIRRSHVSDPTSQIELWEAALSGAAVDPRKEEERRVLFVALARATLLPRGPILTSVDGRYCRRAGSCDSNRSSRSSSRRLWRRLTGRFTPSSALAPFRPHREATMTSEIPNRGGTYVSDLRLFVVVPAGIEPATFRV